MLSLNDFFQLTAIPADAQTGQYSLMLVILSYVVATFASYIALDLTGRLRDPHTSDKAAIGWLCGGAFAMGAGIWSMHFIGMLAFKMNMPMSYDTFWTILSMIAAIFASFFALLLLKERIINITRLALGGIILGFGIATMHYLGMEAMKSSMDIHYLPGLFMLSILIAIIASEAALWLALKSNQARVKYRVYLKMISALVMGAAICGMHYVGMFSAVFTPHHIMVMQHINSIEPDILALGVAGVTFIILGIAFFLSMYKEAMTANQLINARQAGMTEVATSVLHNVGNILNSVNVSVTMISEHINASRLEGLIKLNDLFEQHKQQLSQFLTEDERGKNIPDYIKLLSRCWREDQTHIKNEIDTLTKNIEHIKNIISMQQELGKATGMEQQVSLQEIIDEALTITGLTQNKYHIEIVCHSEANDQLYLDKIKLIQILVNILQNAKDAVLTSTALYKRIQIKIYHPSKSDIVIEISDNGIGIPTDHLLRIFSYGFTTKKSGHGFGLHSCSLAANEMGGTITAHSEGINQGATFKFTLPFNNSSQ